MAKKTKAEKHRPWHTEAQLSRSIKKLGAWEKSEREMMSMGIGPGVLYHIDPLRQGIYWISGNAGHWVATLVLTWGHGNNDVMLGPNGREDHVSHHSDYQDQYEFKTRKKALEAVVKNFQRRQKRGAAKITARSRY